MRRTLSKDHAFALALDKVYIATCRCGLQRQSMMSLDLQLCTESASKSATLDYYLLSFEFYVYDDAVDNDACEMRSCSSTRSIR